MASGGNPGRGGAAMGAERDGHVDVNPARPVRFDCTICFGSLDEPALAAEGGNPEQPPTEPNDEIVATHCGHVYHNDCLNRWFNEKQEKHRAAKKPGRAPRQCPLCFGPAPPSRVAKLYMSSVGHETSLGPAPRVEDDIENDVDEQCHNHRCQNIRACYNFLTKENEKLQDRNNLQTAAIQSLEEEVERLKRGAGINPNPAEPAPAPDAEPVPGPSGASRKRRRYFFF